VTVIDNSVCYYNDSIKVLLVVPNYTSVTDYEGYEYNAVKIGEQVWLDENLRTTHYTDGSNIESGYDIFDLSTETEPQYWFNYDNDLSLGNIYGKLYTWYVINNGNICPESWHVPSDLEWTALTDYLGGASIAGDKLKEAGLLHWDSPNTGATNETGFTALPGGGRTQNIGFYTDKVAGYWWTSSEGSPNEAFLRAMFNDFTSVHGNDTNKKHGFSIRCIKNQ